MKKEITTNEYNNLDKTTMSSLKKQMKSLEGSMLSIAEKCYQLREQDENQFYTFAMKELNLSKSTISKFVIAGKISIECGGVVELPNSYSAVYELNKVSDDIESFNEYYVEVNNEELKNGSQRKINKTVNTYLNDAIEDETLEESTGDNELETEVDNAIIENIENLKALITGDIEKLDKKFNKETFSDLKSSINLLFEII